VLFDVSKSNIKPEFDSHLREVADFMKKHPDAVMGFAGHTDSDADPKVNIPLSAARAAAVRTRLLKLGVNPSQLRKEESHSEDRPALENTTKSNKAENRRVVGRAEAVGIGDEPALQGFIGTIK
jgi:outer membrane protein OmpA-like peptidoglycan-associated protein